MKCKDCNKKAKKIYERIGKKAIFTPIGIICKNCKKIIKIDYKE